MSDDEIPGTLGHYREHLARFKRAEMRRVQLVADLKGAESAAHDAAAALVKARDAFENGLMS